MRKIRVLQLIASLHQGGGERLAIDLAKALIERDVDLHFCAFGSDTAISRGWTMLKELQELPCNHLIVPSRNLYDVSAYLKIAQYIRRSEIDVIHTHLVDADIVGNILGQLLNTPVVTTLHNNTYQYESYSNVRHWLMRNFVTRNASSLVSISTKIRQDFISQWSVTPRRVSTIHNAIIAKNYLDIPLGTLSSRQDEQLVITTVGRLEPQKAQHLLLDAAKLVLEESPRTKFQIVGTGSLKDALQQQAAQLDIQNNVEFLGSRNDIPCILADTDIFVLSSEWEGLPVSAIEAMIAARPVVLSNVGGNSELIIDNEHGFLVPPNDVDSLAHALCRFLSDRRLRVEMGCKARIRAIENFGMDTMVSKYQQQYKAAIN